MWSNDLENGCSNNVLWTGSNDGLKMTMISRLKMFMMAWLRPFRWNRYESDSETRVQFGCRWRSKLCGQQTNCNLQSCNTVDVVLTTMIVVLYMCFSFHAGTCATKLNAFGNDNTCQIISKLATISGRNLGSADGNNAFGRKSLKKQTQIASAQQKTGLEND